MTNNFTKEKIEFLTVAVETCKFFEQCESLDPNDFINKTSKLLPLLYLKASMIEAIEPIGEDDLERFVTEMDYERVREQVANLLGTKDDYFDSFNPEVGWGDRTIANTISEDLADVYQNLKDYAANCQIGDETIMNDALSLCISDFKNYWGAKLLGALRALHVASYANETTNDEL